MEKKLKELLLQVEDERRNADQFKNEVGFGLHLKCNKLVQTSSKPRDDLHLILGNFSNGDHLIIKKKKKLYSKFKFHVRFVAIVVFI